MPRPWAKPSAQPPGPSGWTHKHCDSREKRPRGRTRHQGKASIQPPLRRPGHGFPGAGMRPDHTSLDTQLGSQALSQESGWANGQFPSSWCPCTRVSSDQGASDHEPGLRRTLPRVPSVLSGDFRPPGHFAAKGLVPRPLYVGIGLSTLLPCCYSSD